MFEKLFKGIYKSLIKNDSSSGIYKKVNDVYKMSLKQSRIGSGKIVKSSKNMYRPKSAPTKRANFAKIPEVQKDLADLTLGKPIQKSSTSKPAQLTNVSKSNLSDAKISRSASCIPKVNMPSKESVTKMKQEYKDCSKKCLESLKRAASATKMLKKPISKSNDDTESLSLNNTSPNTKSPVTSTTVEVLFDQKNNPNKELKKLPIIDNISVPLTNCNKIKSSAEPSTIITNKGAISKIYFRVCPNCGYSAAKNIKRIPKWIKEMTRRSRKHAKQKVVSATKDCAHDIKIVKDVLKATSCKDGKPIICSTKSVKCKNVLTSVPTKKMDTSKCPSEKEKPKRNPKEATNSSSEKITPTRAAKSESNLSFTSTVKNGLRTEKSTTMVYLWKKRSDKEEKPVNKSLPDEDIAPLSKKHSVPLTKKKADLNEISKIAEITSFETPCEKIMPAESIVDRNSSTSGEKSLKASLTYQEKLESPSSNKKIKCAPKTNIKHGTLKCKKSVDSIIRKKHTSSRFASTYQHSNSKADESFLFDSDLDYKTDILQPKFPSLKVLSENSITLKGRPPMCIGTTTLNMHPKLPIPQSAIIGTNSSKIFKSLRHDGCDYNDIMYNPKYPEKPIIQTTYTNEILKTALKNLSNENCNFCSCGRYNCYYQVDRDEPKSTESNFELISETNGETEKPRARSRSPPEGKTEKFCRLKLTNSLKSFFAKITSSFTRLANTDSFVEEKGKDKIEEIYSSSNKRNNSSKAQKSSETNFFPMKIQKRNFIHLASNVNITEQFGKTEPKYSLTEQVKSTTMIDIIKTFSDKASEKGNQNTKPSEQTISSCPNPSASVNQNPATVGKQYNNPCNRPDCPYTSNNPMDKLNCPCANQSCPCNKIYSEVIPNCPCCNKSCPCQNGGGSKIYLYIINQTCACESHQKSCPCGKPECPCAAAGICNCNKKQNQPCNCGQNPCICGTGLLMKQGETSTCACNQPCPCSKPQEGIPSSGTIKSVCTCGNNPCTCGAKLFTNENLICNCGNQPCTCKPNQNVNA